MEFIKIKDMGGIKCDNPNCNYRDDSVKPEDYPKWVNKACPICGSNLLTEADYKAFMKTINTVNRINRIYYKLPKFLKNYFEKDSDKTKKEMSWSVNFDGTGTVKHHVDIKKSN